MPKKGSRRIVVDGVQLRWRIRSRPTYSEGNAWSPLTVGVEGERGGSVLVLVFAGARPDNWVGEAITVATPAAVASAIRRAVDAGWVVDGSGGPTFFDVANGRVSAQQGGSGQEPPGAEWCSYDPEWLVGLAATQHPDAPWLLVALRACRQIRPESKAYVHFVDPGTAAWRFEQSLVLESAEHGTLVLDILEGQVVGGVEFLSRT